MPTIAFSNAFMSGSATTFMGRMMTYNVTNGVGLLAAGGEGYTGWRGAGYLSLMKGTVPSNFSSLTAFSSRSADVLCSWFITAGTFSAGNNFTPSSSTANSNPNTIETTYVAASASGTATWIWFVTRGYRQYSPGNPMGFNDQIFWQIIATVTETGGGGDLEIPSTTITTNQLLRVTNLRLQLPSTYVY